MTFPSALRRRPWWLLGLLFGLLGVAAARLVQWESQADQAVARQAAEQQLRAGAAIVAAELGKGDYQDVAVLFDAWGRANGEVSVLRLTAANGYRIAEFVRPGMPEHRLELQTGIDYSYRGHARLDLTVSLEPAWQRRQAFIAGFAGLLVVLGALSALLLHYALRGRANARHAVRMSHLYAALSEVNQAIVRMGSPDELFPLVCRCAVEFGGMRMAWVGRAGPDGDHVVPLAVQGDDTGYLDGLYISCRADVPEGRGPTGIALRENRAVIVNDFLGDPATAPWRRKAAAAGWAACATFPVSRGGTAFAAISVYHDRAGAFDREAIALLQELAQDVGFALDNFDREAERHAGEEAMRLAASVYEGSSDGIVMADAHGRILAVNPAFSRITGIAAGEVTGRQLDELGWPAEQEEWQRVMWTHIRAGGRWAGEVRDLRRNGSILHLWITVDTVIGAQGEVLRRVFLMQDISGSKEAQETIWRQANFDSLTGLPNRQMFREQLRHEFGRAERQGGGLALLHVDLDRFQQVNEQLGHGGADELLADVAGRLRACLPEGAMLARLGSDEFAVLLGGGGLPLHTESTADELMRCLESPFEVAGERLHVTCSIGIAQFPGDAADDAGLLRSADQALHAAKAAGRSRYNFFTAAMQHASQARLRIARSLRGALAGNQFLLYFQPIVDLSDGRVCKAEALIRWRHPEDGLVAPGTFIGVAEETGLIGEIGDWVFREAARQAAGWRRDFDPGFRVSINTSPVQFQQPQARPAGWPAYLEAIGLPGDAIEIEITENVLLEASAGVQQLLHQLRAAGIRLAQDDFGTGYSSLSYLRRLAIDFVKIDQSFVRNLATRSDDQALCEAIIAMAHSLDIRVVAEGIETAFQRDLLAAAGCDFGQGYLFSHPLPPAEFAQLLEAEAQRRRAG